MKLVAIILIILLIGFMIGIQLEEYELQEDEMLDWIKTQLNPVLDSSCEGYTENKKLLDLLESRKNVLNEIVLYKGDKSYTINKHKVYLCLYNEKNKYYNNNLLLYVTLHEISHCISPEVGHTELFYEIFDILLKKASAMGVYDSSKKIDPNYCTYNDDTEETYISEPYTSETYISKCPITILN